VYPRRALDDEPAAAPERRSRTERGADDVARRRTMWKRIAVGVAVLALAAVAAFLLLGDGGSLLPGGEDEGPAGFSFELGRVRAAPISERSPSDLQDEADEAADAVKATMDELYFAAYVDRDAWGSYDDAFSLFLGAAADGAREDVDVLTLGSDAPEEYDSLVEPAGTLQVVVLTDDDDVAIGAVARVRFLAEAERTAGGSARITSRGAFFLRPGQEGWRIYAYRIDRNEQDAASPSPTEGATP
jgi:hypothetical protein